MTRTTTRRARCITAAPASGAYAILTTIVGYAAALPAATLHTITSHEGHDGFMLEEDQVGRLLTQFLGQPLNQPTGGAAKGGALAADAPFLPLNKRMRFVS